jgi:two-component system sensor histidine kinase KdpD
MAFGRGPAVLAAVTSVALFDFAFVPPRFTFRVTDTQYLVTFGVMLVVALVIGTLIAWLREQRELATQRELRATALHRLSRDLALRSSMTDVVSAAVGRIQEILGSGVVVWLPDENQNLAIAAGSLSQPVADSVRDDARRVFEQRSRRAYSREGPSLLHLPLEAGLVVSGVISVEIGEDRGPRTRERLDLLRALASQTGLAIERCRLTARMEQARFEAEAERGRNALLSSVSHDLRTPLASIIGAASNLREGLSAMPERTRQELVDTIVEESSRLDRLIGGILDMTRLEAGIARVRKDWHSVEEVVGAVLVRMEPILDGRNVRVEIEAGLPLVPLDPLLFGLVLENLIGNAIRYSPSMHPIEIRARTEAGELRLEVADHGPGFEPGEEERVFEKFYRGPGAARLPGLGLGLAICKAAVQAHGGRLSARNRPAGGALLQVCLPLEGGPELVETDGANDPDAHEMA